MLVHMRPHLKDAVIRRVKTLFYPRIFISDGYPLVMILRVIIIAVLIANESSKYCNAAL